MYNSSYRHCIDYSWENMDPPGGDPLPEKNCPHCDEPMEWQKVNLQFYCCSCDECSNAQEIDFEPEDDYERRYHAY